MEGAEKTVTLDFVATGFSVAFPTTWVAKVAHCFEICETGTAVMGLGIRGLEANLVFEVLGFLVI